MQKLLEIDRRNFYRLIYGAVYLCICVLGPDFTCHAGTFSEFAKCMEWVSGLELQVLDGTWRDNLTIPHVPPSDGNDDAASSEPTTSSHAYLFALAN